MQSFAVIIILDISDGCAYLEDGSCSPTETWFEERTVVYFDRNESSNHSAVDQSSLKRPPTIRILVVMHSDLLLLFHNRSRKSSSTNVLKEFM